MAFRVFAPDSRVTARNRDRSFFRPWGVLGGRAAGLSDMMVNPGTPHAKRLGNIDTVVLQPGDVLEIRSAGGGGRGDPFEREAWRVAADVRRGYVSPEAAEREYGVVLRDGVVDEPATRGCGQGGPRPPCIFISARNAKATRRSGMLRRTPICMRSSTLCRSIGASSRRPRFSGA